MISLHTFCTRLQDDHRLLYCGGREAYIPLTGSEEAGLAIKLLGFFMSL